MAGNVVFYLTDHQAAALLSIQAGQGMPGPRSKYQARIATALRRRGLIDDELRLTGLGIAACAVADRLAASGA